MGGIIQASVASSVRLFGLNERQNSSKVDFKTDRHAVEFCALMNPAADSARHQWLQNSLIISLVFIPFFLCGRLRCAAFNPLYNPLTVYKLQCAARWNFLSAHLNGSMAGLWNVVPMDAEAASYDRPQQMQAWRQGRRERSTSTIKVWGMETYSHLSWPFKPFRPNSGSWLEKQFQ